MLLDRKRSLYVPILPLAILVIPVTLVPGAARAGQGTPASPAPASPVPASPAPAPPVPGSPSPAPAWKLDAETAPDRAQLSSRKLRAVRVETPPKIDGDLSDPVWEQAARAGTFSDAFTFSTAIDQTEARVCYDSEAIYVAFYCRDSRPEAVVAREIRRDAQFQGEDTVSVVLDPYRTRRGNDSNYFVVNALGTGASYIAGGRAGKREWKGDWESAARRVEDGWTAEMRIPWQILNFPARSEPSTIGLNFQRRQQRTDIRSFWSNLGPNERSELAGDWEEVQLPKSSFKRELSLLPFTTTRYNLGSGSQFDFGVGRTRMANLGLDARLAITPDLTAVGTLNPDFATVERAVEGIDFTRGERFLPDARPFFREGEDFFNLTGGGGGGGWGSPFFSGRIPEFDAGVKVFGRYGPKDSLGFLGTYNLDRSRGDLVGRWIRDVGPGSFVSTYLVQRALPGDENLVVGSSASIRKGTWRLRSNLATSRGPKAGGSAGNVGVSWFNERLRIGLGWTRVEKDFRAANGFVRFTDYQGPDLFARYETEWRKGPIRELEVSLFGMDQQRTDGQFFRRFLDLGASVETRSDWGLRVGWEGGQFFDERDSAYSVGVTRNLSNRYNRVGLGYTFGTRADEPIQFFTPFISQRLFGGWDVSVASSLLTHRGRNSLHVIGFNREIDQYRAIGGRVLVRDGYVHYFASYRVSGGRGMETYFILGDPVATSKHSQTSFFTKFVFPMSL